MIDDADVTDRFREVYEQFISALRDEPSVRFVELHGSLMRKTADHLSDIDVRIGVSDSDYLDFPRPFQRIIDAIGPVAQTLRHDDPELGGITNERWFVLFEDGMQLDCATVPMRTVEGRGPETIVLYDSDGRGDDLAVPSVLDGGRRKVEEWTALAWVALIDVWKYLERGAIWEAYTQIHQARTCLLQLWATAQELEYPALGIVAAFDAPVPTIPEGLEETVCSLDPASIRRAGLACAALLDEAIPRAAAATDAQPGDGFRRWVLPLLRHGRRPPAMDPTPPPPAG